jgi:hypothetical protein
VVFGDTTGNFTEVRSGIDPGDTVIISDVAQLEDQAFFNLR